MCVHIPKEIWDRHKAELTDLARRDRPAAMLVIEELNWRTEFHSRAGMVRAVDETELIDELLASIEAKAAYEESRDLVAV